jgi:shikimate dehydrogenase
VLGSPIAHSLSPVLHQAAYRALGLTGWSYEAIECDERGLPGLLGSLGPNWAGLSLTMPLKRAVLPLLDWADPLVTDVGAANTVLLRNGQRLGHNTDVAGLAKAMRHAGVPLQGNALVIGGGATACSALVALRETGTWDITVAVRALARAEPLVRVARRLGVGAQVVELLSAGPAGQPALEPALAGQPWALLISTVPAAGAEGVAVQVGTGELTARAVFDVIYDPWPTPLATAAASVGSTVISGYEMLVELAAEQVELMTGRQAPIDAMRLAGAAELGRRRNI